MRPYQTANPLTYVAYGIALAMIVALTWMLSVLADATVASTPTFTEAELVAVFSGEPVPFEESDW
jgi:hypothetical protein